MGLALGLLQSGGFSRTPVSLGQAFGQGVGTARQFQQYGQQQQAWQQQQQQDAERQKMIAQALGLDPQANAQPPQNPQGTQASPQTPQAPQMPAPAQMPPQTFSGAGIPGYQGPQSFQGAPIQPTHIPLPMPSALPSQQAAQAPQISPWQQKAQADMQRYQQLSKTAVLTGNPQLQQYADNQKSLMQNTWHQMTPDEVKAKFGGQLPGINYRENELGQTDQTGSSTMRVVNIPDAYGIPQPTMINMGDPNALQKLNNTQAQQVQNREHIVDMLGTYKLKPSAYMQRSVQGQAILAEVHAKYPNYDAKNYDTVQQALKDFTTGRIGSTIAAANKVVAHLDTVSSLAQNLDNQRAPIWNRLANRFKQEFGSSAPTNFDTAKRIALTEVSKFLTGYGQGGQEERQQMIDLVNRSQSPEQLNGAISTVKQMMGGQLMALKKQWDSSLTGTGADKLPAYNFDSRFLYPETQNLLKNLEQEPNYTGQGSPNSGWSITPVNSGG
jgi:hypothetical protein